MARDAGIGAATLGGAVREIVENRVVSGAIGVGVFVILTSLGAFVRIPLPFTPVPITLQTMFVLMAGAALGSRLGPLSQASYIVLGVAGLPIFAGANAGWHYVTRGATGGYLVGFVVAAWVVGAMTRLRRETGIFWLLLSMFVGTLVIYLFGVAHLAFILGWSFKKALALGVVPFLPGDLAKLLAAAGLTRGGISRFRALFSV